MSIPITARASCSLADQLTQRPDPHQMGAAGAQLDSFAARVHDLRGGDPHGAGAALSASAMNYRHAFHAGGFADVMKHIIADAADRISEAEARGVPGDRHACRHRPLLADRRRGAALARMAGRHRQAARRPTLPDKAAALIQPYLDVVERRKPERHPRPLSRLAAARAKAVPAAGPAERTGAASRGLPRAAANCSTGDVQARVTALDGWLALNAYVPPKEKRGLVLVDPPFEEDGRVRRGWSMAWPRPTANGPPGIYALWYPLKDPREVNAFVADLKATGIPRMLRVELMIDARARRHALRLRHDPGQPALHARGRVEDRSTGAGESARRWQGAVASGGVDPWRIRERRGG